MSDSLRQAVTEIEAKIKSHLDEVADLKKAANALCRIIGTDPLYPEDEPSEGAVGPSRADAYYGKQFSTAAREYLEFRKRACSAEEVLNGLEKGGFDFDALGWKGEHRLRSVAVSLAKNTAMFRRLPNGTFGLNAWYSDAPAPKRRGKGKAEDGAAAHTSQPATEQPDATSQDQSQSDVAGEAPAETEANTEEKGLEAEASRPATIN